MIVMLFLFTNLLWASPVNETLREYGLQVPETPALKLIKNQKVSGEKSQHVIELETSAREHIEIRIIGPLPEDAAKTLLSSERSRLAGLYAAPQTPYMGDIAQAVGGCPSSLGPKNSTVSFLGSSREVLLGAATAERAFGACAKDQVRYKGAFWAYYDTKTKSVWQWRAFVPWRDQSKLTSHWLAPLVGQFSQ